MANPGDPSTIKPRGGATIVWLWVALGVIVLAAAAGFYVYDQRQAARIDVLKADLAQVRATAGRAIEAARKRESDRARQVDRRVTTLNGAVKKLQVRAAELDALKGAVKKLRARSADLDALKGAVTKLQERAADLDALKDAVEKLQARTDSLDTKLKSQAAAAVRARKRFNKLLASFRANGGKATFEAVEPDGDGRRQADHQGRRAAHPGTGLAAR